MGFKKNLIFFFSAFIAAILSILLFPALNNSTALTKWLGLKPFSHVIVDLVVTDAFIYTSDSSLPFADAMAIRDGRIIRVGNYSSVENLLRHGAKELKLNGKVVVPGFIDSHVHFLWGGLQMVQVQLQGVSSKEEFVRMVKEAVTEKHQGCWVLGGGWNNELWGGDLPVASWIDDITPHNPVWLSRMDGHMGLANSLALRMAGISNYTKDPDGGTVMRTSVGDVYQWADSKGKMLMRVCLFFPMETWSRLQDLIHNTGRVLSEWIYLGGVKAFVDGSLGSNSALFFEPYADEPYNYGLLVTPIDSLSNMTMESDKARLQVAIHAIGDKANDLILDMYDSVASSNGNRDRRFRIEHAQHLAPGAVIRFGQQKIIASVQPEHLLDDVSSMAKKLGVDRAEKESYLFHSLLASNAPLAFGSDWPVAKINPLGAIKAAMKRTPPGWAKSWVPSECISLRDALNAHTISAAYANFLDQHIGSLSPGKLADFVVLSTDSWDNFESKASTSIEATYVSGVKAYP